MKKIVLIFFIAAILIASLLRLYNLAEAPPGVNRDEASIGYTAHSLLKTGADEYARSFPVSFESFGDWKLPLYIYTVVPFVSFFGLSELAVRLPSSIFGILSVAATFYLVRILFKNNFIAIISMLLAAIAPWSIHLSRVESESNTAVFFTLCAVILFLKSLEKKSWLIVASLIFFALTYFTYAGNHIFTTLFLAVLFFLYRKEIPRKKTLAVGVLIFSVMVFFIFSHTLFGANKTKLSGISIFGDPSVVHSQIEIPRNEHTDKESIFQRIVHNRVVYAIEKVGQNYLNSFSPEFLFIKGGENSAHNILNFGNMYIVEAPFLFMGIMFLIINRKSKEKKLILLWFFLSPIAASITKDAPHTNRMFAVFPMTAVITSIGIYWFFTEIIKKELIKKILAVVVVCGFLLNIFIYLDRYYVHFSRNEVSSWGFGYKSLNELLDESKYASKKIIMSRPHYSPYIYLLFYSKYEPMRYQEEAVRYAPSSDGFVDVRGYGRFEFREINWERDLQEDAILVDWSIDVPEYVKNKHTIKEIFLPNGESMFSIIDANEK
jgi:4-amino-4-deoxy-L-arabinose transferase-like glycosyltransferase